MQGVNKKKKKNSRTSAWDSQLFHNGHKFTFPSVERKKKAKAFPTGIGVRFIYSLGSTTNIICLKACDKLEDLIINAGFLCGNFFFSAEVSSLSRSQPVWPWYRTWFLDEQDIRLEWIRAQRLWSTLKNSTEQNLCAFINRFMEPWSALCILCKFIVCF